VTTLAIGWIQPGPFQPRRNFDDEALKELAESVRARGILQPLLVRPVKGLQNRYEIIAGERRWRAAQIAGLHELPVVIRELADSEALEFGLIENVQRQDLSPLEEAEGYKRLMEEFLHTQEVLAKIVGKSRSHIGNLVRLLALPAGVRQMIDSNELSAGHARALVAAKDPLALAIRIVKEGLNVRQAEALARGEAETPQNPKKKIAPDANVLALQKDLARATGLKINIASRGRKGSITLHYQNLEQLDAVIAKLKS
jgi:ParB family chromosome partitioning protein